MDKNGNPLLPDVDKNSNLQIISDDSILYDQYTQFFHVIHKKK